MKILLLAVLVLALIPAIPGGKVAADAGLPGIQTAALYGSHHSAAIPEDRFSTMSARGISATSATPSGLTHPVQFNQFMFLLLFLLFLVAGVELGVHVQGERRQPPPETTDGTSA